MSNQRVSDEEQQLRKRARRRLVGSVFTVLLAAVVLPFVLASKPKPVASNVAVYLPPGAGVEAVAAPASQSATSPSPAQPVAAVSPRPTSVTPAAKVQAKPAAVPAKADKESAPPSDEKKLPVAKKPTTDSVKKDGHWVLQVGTFRDIKHAGQLKSKLQSKGLHAYTEAIEINGEQQVRLRIGPFGSRDAALHARDRLADLKLSGIALNVR